MRKIPQEIVDQIVKDPKIRIAITRESHEAFFAVYLAHYLKYPSAPFHEELFELTEDSSIKNTVIVAFRGSGKSTIITLSYPLWAITGKQQKKFVLILAHTIYQAKMYMKNIKEELENNEILRADLGPFQEEDEWQSYSVIIPKYNARIVCASYEQGIRGLRHRQYRPDLIICDDVEDLESVKTLEGRDKVYDWLTGEVIPAGDKNTGLMVVGNLLHEDSLIMRLKNKIDEKKMDGIFRAYPIMDDEGNITWPGKFTSMIEIEAERIKVGNEVAWQREYMLRIVPDEDRLIDPKWIKTYDEIPSEKGNDFRFNAVGIDLAISKSEKADYTAMVVAKVYGNGENLRIFILPNPVNERLSSLEAQQRAESIWNSLGDSGPTNIFIEDVGYQGSFIECLKNKNIHAEGCKVHGQDKRARLNVITHLIQLGRVLFPQSGANDLISQLINFGFQKHDDLADAFAILLHKILEEYNRPVPHIEWITIPRSQRGLSRFEDEDGWAPFPPPSGWDRF